MFRKLLTEKTPGPSVFTNSERRNQSNPISKTKDNEEALRGSFLEDSITRRHKETRAKRKRNHKSPSFMKINTKKVNEILTNLTRQ